MKHPADAFAVQRTLHRLDGDLDLLGDVLEVFRDETPDIMAGLRRALDEGNTAAAASAAHSLRGALLNISADEVADVATRAEQLAAWGQLEAASTVAAELEAELDRLVQRLAHLDVGLD